MLNMNAFHLLGSSTGPLSALHSMTDLKVNTGVSPSQLQANSHYRSSPPPGLKQSLAAATTSSSSPSGISSSSTSSAASGTSHYIHDILSRPSATFPTNQSNQALNSALAGALPRFNLGAAAVAAQGMYFSQTNGLSQKLASLGDLSGRHLYWPSMVQNQALWRERLAGAGKNCPLCSYHSTRLSSHCLSSSESNVSRQRRQEEAHPTDLLRPPDLCSGEDVRADKVLGRSRAGKAGLRLRDVRESSEGECCQSDA